MFSIKSFIVAMAFISSIVSAQNTATITNNCDKSVMIRKLVYNEIVDSQTSNYECSSYDTEISLPSDVGVTLDLDPLHNLYTVANIGYSKILDSQGNEYQNNFPNEGTVGDSCDDGGAGEISFFDISRTNDGYLYLCSIVSPGVYPPVDTSPPPPSPVDTSPPPPSKDSPPTSKISPPPSKNSPPPSKNSPPPSKNSPPPPSKNSPPPSKNSPPPSKNSPPPSKNFPPSDTSSGVPIGIVIGASVGGAVLLVAIVILVVCIKRRKNNIGNPSTDYVSSNTMAVPASSYMPRPVAANIV